MLYVSFPATRTRLKLQLNIYFVCFYLFSAIKFNSWTNKCRINCATYLSPDRLLDLDLLRRLSRSYDLLRDLQHEGENEKVLLLIKELKKKKKKPKKRSWEATWKKANVNTESCCLTQSNESFNIFTCNIYPRAINVLDFEFWILLTII